MTQEQQNEIHLRILPSLIMHAIHIAILLVVGVFDLRIQNFGLIEQFAMETQHLFVFLICGAR